MIVGSPAINIVTIADSGRVASERLHMVVLRDCNLANYVVLATIALSADRIYAGFRPAYWFSARDVKMGDHIILYSKEGKDSQGYRSDGHINHFFFWGVKGEVGMFGMNARAVLLEVSNWITSGA